MTALTRAKSMVINDFSLDLRSLGLFRIALALVVLYDLFVESANLIPFYTDQGLITKELIIQYNWLSQFSSIHLLFRDPFGQTLLFGVSAIAAIFLLLGYRTKIASIMCFLLMRSMYFGTLFIHNGGDDILLVLLFLGIFLPLNARFSVD